MSLNESYDLSRINQKRPDAMLVQLNKMQAQIEEMYSVIAAGTNGHADDTDNPHSVTAAQAGLGNVDNYATASQAQMEAGAATDKFATPLGTKQAIDKQIKRASWTMENGLYIATDELRARDSGGLGLYDDAGQGPKVNDGGIITSAYQPAFIAVHSAEQSNIAVNTDVTVIFDTEIKDIGGNFASNTFTAPISGLYFLGTNIRVANLDSAATFYRVRIVTSNRVYFSIFSPDKFAGDVAFWTFSLSTLADMDASDTASVTIDQSGGTAQTDIVQNAGYTVFYGYLVA